MAALLTCCNYTGGSSSASAQLPGDTNPEILKLELEGDKTMNDPGPSLPEPPGPRLRSRGEGTNRKPFVVNLDTFCQKTKTFDEKML